MTAYAYQDELEQAVTVREPRTINDLAGPAVRAAFAAAAESPEVKRALELPLPQDCEQTAVQVTMHGIDGAMITRSFTVQHDSETIVRVQFPEGWRLDVTLLGYDAYSVRVEKMLELLAMRAFRGRTR